jgi:DNA polymerase III epsilon subunit-like protein
MRVLVFDTETTGLPTDASLSAYRAPDNWPHLVSISWAVIDSKTNTVVKSHCYIVKPEKWTISDESTKIHGITQAQASEFGLPLRYVMEQFNSEQHDIMVAHNMHFDKNVVVQAILWDLNIMSFQGFKKPMGCTMLLGRTMCNIPAARGGFKFPKLAELYTHIVGHAPKHDYLHNALFDTLYLCEIIQKSPEIRMRLGITGSEENNAENHALETVQMGGVEVPVPQNSGV